MRHRVRGWSVVAALVATAVILGGCKGDTPEAQATSAAKIATVLTSQPGPSHGVAMEVNLRQERFTSYYRVWFRLPELAKGDKPSTKFTFKTSGTNCGVFGGETSVFDNSRPDELKPDGAFVVDYFLTGRAPDNEEGVWADFAWYHPHPPCGNTPDHKDATITITLSNPSGSFTCTYVGAATGKGECKDNK